MGFDENFKSPYLGNYKEFRTFEGKRAVFIGVKEHDAAIRFSLSLTVFEIWLLTLFRTKCNRVSRPILSVVDPKRGNERGETGIARLTCESRKLRLARLHSFPSPPAAAAAAAETA